MPVSQIDIIKQQGKVALHASYYHYLHMAQGEALDREPRIATISG